MRTPTNEQLRARAQRRRALLDELEQFRALQARVAPRRFRRSREQQVQRLTRLSI